MKAGREVSKSGAKYHYAVGLALILIGALLNVTVLFVYTLPDLKHVLGIN